MDVILSRGIIVFNLKKNLFQDSSLMGTYLWQKPLLYLLGKRCPGPDDFGFAINVHEVSNVLRNKIMMTVTLVCV